MGVYTIISNGQINVAVDLLSSSAFDELEDLKEQGFKVMDEDLEVESASSAITLYEDKQKDSEYYLNEIMLSTDSQLQENIKALRNLGIVTSSQMTKLTFSRKAIESALGAVDMRLNASLKEVENLKKIVLKNLRRECHELGGNAVTGVNLDIQEIDGTGYSMFMVNGIGTAWIVG